MRRLLIIACSQRKSPAPAPLAAIERYDGPAFRVLRKGIAVAPQDAPTVLILSAKFGLIAASTKIPDYDCRMSSALARQLRPVVLETARRTLESRPWQAIAICVGKHYRATLDGLVQFVPESAELSYIEGGLGRRLTNLRAWLRFPASAALARGSI
jgi:hypothetical protein